MVMSPHPRLPSSMLGFFFFFPSDTNTRGNRSWQQPTESGSEVLEFGNHGEF